MDNESLPVSDDVQPVDSGQTEQDLLDAVMRNSPIMDEVAPPHTKHCLLYTSPSPRDS